MSSEKDISREAWLAEPFTQHMLETLSRTVGHRLQDLLTASRKSTDPEVVRAFARYEGALFTRELFAKGEYRDG